MLEELVTEMTLPFNNALQFLEVCEYFLNIDYIRCEGLKKTNVV